MNNGSMKNGNNFLNLFKLDFTFYLKESTNV
ncbi:hypothetical protein FBBAL38_07910 [Flavobacteria bacterium BAL38]|nr:hypothetical protein FBBAL38_07910 [Flavobacteria bacterium BAL38]